MSYFKSEHFLRLQTFRCIDIAFSEKSYFCLQYDPWHELEFENNAARACSTVLLLVSIPTSSQYVLPIDLYANNISLKFSCLFSSLDFRTCLWLCFNKAQKDPHGWHSIYSSRSHKRTTGLKNLHFFYKAIHVHTFHTMFMFPSWPIIGHSILFCGLILYIYQQLNIDGQ